MSTFCDEVITSAVTQVNNDWTCRAVGEGWLLITTSHQYSDGDHVELLVRRDEDSIVISDGGEALARLDLAGVTVDQGRTREMWRRLVRAHELEFHNERLTRQGTVDETGILIESMANAVANIDGIRLLAAPPRSARFADRLVTFFQAEFEYVAPSPQLRGRSGGVYRATAAVGEPAHETLVQAVAGANITGRQRAVEHAFTMFSDVNGSLLAEQKLVVLGEGEWKSEQTRLLASVAYVGSWSYREQVIDFIHDPKRFDSRMLGPLQGQSRLI